jgi:hypothetical protein
LIIDSDEVCTNALAYDHGRDNKRRYMLTNCFRVWDRQRGEYLQAEIALEVSDLGIRQEEHRSLRELGIANQVKQERLIELERARLIVELDTHFNEALQVLTAQHRDLERVAHSIANRLGKKEAEDVTHELITDNMSKRNALEAAYRKIKAKLTGAHTLADLDCVALELPAAE